MKSNVNKYEFILHEEKIIKVLYFCIVISITMLFFFLSGTLLMHKLFQDVNLRAKSIVEQTLFSILSFPLSVLAVIYLLLDGQNV